MWNVRSLPAVARVDFRFGHIAVGANGRVKAGNCLGLSDTCPTRWAGLRIKPTGGQVLDKPRGRKPRRMWQRFVEASLLWRLGVQAAPTQRSCAHVDGREGREAAV